MKRLLGVLLLAGLLVGVAPVAHAAFRQQAGAQAAFSTGTLAAPSGLSATARCRLLAHEVALSWTATTSTWNDGYEVSRATSSSGPYSVVPLPVGGDPKATTRVVGGLSASTTYWFRVAATRGSWRSVPVQASATTGSICLL